MEKFLLQFQKDKSTREAVKAFMEETLTDMAVQRVWAKEDTTSIADARLVIETAFVKLEELYGEKQKNEVTNQAR